MPTTPSDNSRRRFIRLALAGLAAVPFSNLLLSRAARSQESAKVEQEEPLAIQLGYKMDAAEVDKAKHPERTEGQFCHNCKLYVGKAGEDWGPCTIFGGRLVKANGWCSAWTPREG